MDGQLIAIKRSKQGSMQGGLEFKTEIELLSRVHHKNLVGLVGFCFEKGERMLVYEFISNGTLSESLYGTLTCPSLSLSQITSSYTRSSYHDYQPG
jgi:serine/threonine protein kinase